ncbi:MAG: FdtA/QdtA family cupin domain-containing protein [Patescibacteria group bacterium]
MKIKVKNSGIVKLTAKKHPCRGHLFVGEAARHIPFSIRRIYFINNLKDSLSNRGNHAHKKLKQAIFCLSGSFILNLDDGKNKQKILMKNPEIGIILGPKLWHSMGHFSKGCVILVLASGYYKESDYIRKHEDFLKFVL